MFKIKLQIVKSKNQFMLKKYNKNQNQIYKKRCKMKMKKEMNKCQRRKGHENNRR